MPAPFSLMPNRPERTFEVEPADPDGLLTAFQDESSLQRISRATALAEILASAAHLDGPDAGSIRDRVLELYRDLAGDAEAKLNEEAAKSTPIGIALRHLVANLVRHEKLDQARTLADSIPVPAQRISSQLIVIERLARGTEADRLEARRLLEQAEGEIGRDLPRRLERSPRLAECSAIWAILGETTRALGSRHDCLLLDRLHADTVVLARFGLAAGEEPGVATPSLFTLPPVFDNSDAGPKIPIVLTKPRLPMLRPNPALPKAPPPPVRP